MSLGSYLSIELRLYKDNGEKLIAVEGLLDSIIGDIDSSVKFLTLL